MPEAIHKPVLLTEVLAALQPRTGGQYVDGTLGAGGHASAVLAASGPDGFLWGSDRDGAALAAAAERLAEYAGRFELRRGDFAGLAEWLVAGSCDGVLLDLGVSSMQFDTPERGFSFQQDGPLDMRMDPSEPLTAAAVVNEWDEAELAQIFWELGDEPQARRLARVIAQERRKQPFVTTRQLAGLIERLFPRQGSRRHPATRAFMALRMTVNHEVSSLRSGLAAACTLLKRGGRLAVITFHSVEDRVVKAFGRDQTREYTFAGEVDVPELRTPRAPPMRWVERKAIRPGEAEVAANPRARSAQLRVLERLAHGT